MNTTFPAGTLDSWDITITQYLPAANNLILKTVDPVICAALLALTGTTAEFSRNAGSYNFSYDKLGLPISLQAILIYKVPSFKVADAGEKAIIQDKTFIMGYLSQLKQIKVQSIQIDVKKGEVIITIETAVGYTND